MFIGYIFGISVGEGNFLNMEWLNDLGLGGLFIGCFFSASLLPVSSEFMLQGYFLMDDRKWLAFIIASTGNVLGIILNYFIGYRLEAVAERKYNKFSIAVEKAKPYYDKFGKGALFMSVFPIIGDPITLVAGVMKQNIFVFLIIAGGLRVLRYSILLWVNL